MFAHTELNIAFVGNTEHFRKVINLVGSEVSALRPFMRGHCHY